MFKKLLILALVCASLGLAQKNKGGSSDGGTPQAMGPPNKFENIAMTLNLTKDQKKTVKTILDEGAKEAAPLRDQISKSRIVVGEAIDTKKSDDELKQVARTSSDLSTQLTRLELETFAKVVGTLDETQRKNIQSLGRVLVMMSDIFHVKNWNE
jgi:hypothetical protein